MMRGLLLCDAGAAAVCYLIRGVQFRPRFVQYNTPPDGFYDSKVTSLCYHEPWLVVKYLVPIFVLES